MKTDFWKYVLTLVAGSLLGAAVYGSYNHSTHSKGKDKPIPADRMDVIDNDTNPDGTSSIEKFMENDFDHFSQLMNQQMQDFRSHFETRFKDLGHLQKTTVNVEDQKNGVLYKISLNDPKDDISVKVSNGMLKFEEKMQKKVQSKNDSFDGQTNENYLSTQIFSLPQGVDENNFTQKVVGNELQIFFPKKSS